ncbi:MAG: AMP-binding protein [Deltaproteobacteria bacterium]|nr:AMP-binding protein [Deltaproteobacteria bacterium]
MPEAEATQAPPPGYRCYPERLNIAREALERPVEDGLGGHPALLYEGGAVTYGELKRRVDALARELKRLDVERGDLVLIRMANAPEFAIASPRNSRPFSRRPSRVSPSPRPRARKRCARSAGVVRYRE